jgi:putative oxidoreductase
LQRLFSNFANGLPGVGLLLQRLIAGIALIQSAVCHLIASTQLGMLLPELTGLGAGLLLIIGLWTPITGVVIAIVEVLWLIAGSDAPWVPVLLAMLGITLAFIGPGAWSVDARIFGRKQISVPRRQGF